MRVYQKSGAMLNKIAIFAAAVILAAPICAAAGGSSSGGGSSTGTGVGGGASSAGGNSAGGGAGSHSGGGGDAGHGGGANGVVAHSGGLSGGAAAATARSVAYGHELSHGGISHTDAMHATHFPGVNHSEGEHTSSKLPSMDHPNRGCSYRCEPKYRAPFNQQLIPACVPDADMNNKWSWFDCNGPTKSQSGHKS
jgi:hypothetical protein